MTRKAVDHLRRIASALLVVSALVAGSVDLRGASGDELTIRATTDPTASVPVAVGVTPSAVAVTTTAVTSSTGASTTGTPSIGPALAASPTFALATETPKKAATAVPAYASASPTMSVATVTATPIAQSSPVALRARSSLVRAASATFESTFANISAGFIHTCAVSSIGEGWCWGDNTTGQVGDGTTSTRFSPVAVALPVGETGWAALSAGYQHTCGVTISGTAYCWGDNTHGQLGDATTTSRLAPNLVNGGIIWATVAAGVRHTCALDTVGTAYCWGDNSSYALGDGTTVSRRSPSPVQTSGLGSSAFTHISVGQYHTCANLASGGTYCWGFNGSGRLGDGAEISDLNLHPVSTSDPLVSVTAGAEHSCGVVSTASPSYMVCWGANSAGQLGNSTTSSQLSPARVSGDRNWRSVSSSNKTTCGIDKTDIGYCWGSGGYGQIGDGATQNRSAPTALLTSLKWAQLSAGGSHTCGITLTGKAYCWGSNSSGQIGDGSSVARQLLPVIIPADPGISSITRGASNARVGTTSASPTFVVSFSRSVSGVATSNFKIVTGSGVSGTPVVSSVSPGSTSSISHTVTVSLAGVSASGGSTSTIGLALASVSGIVDTGGNQVASASLSVTSETYLLDTVAPSITSVIRASGADERTAGTTEAVFTVTTSEPVTGVSNGSFEVVTGSGISSSPTFSLGVAYVDISAGGSHTCGISADLVAYCWGSNAYGQLGNGTNAGAPSPTSVAGGHTWKAFSTGSTHTCGITVAGSAYCWGQNSSGQIGNGTYTDATSPAPVSTSGLSATTWIAITAGDDHTCGILTGGTAYCWGANANGQLGDATSSNRNVPVAIAGTAWISIASGGSHTCGQRSSGLYCWGLNTDGQLGDGSNASKNSPTLVTGGRSWQAITVGSSHSCGITTGGEVYCWGANTSGQLGTATASASNTPAIVSGGLNWSAIEAGGDQTCALSQSSRLYCWGDTAVGQSGGFVNRAQPTLAGADTTWSRVNVGGTHACAVRVSGVLDCWGLGTSGQLGSPIGAITRPTRVQVAGSRQWSAVAPGRDHTCAVATAGALYCWGANDEGQLAGTASLLSATPVASSNSVPMSMVSSGPSHSCAVATASPNLAYCWGANGDGRLGDGTAINRTAPSAVAGLTAVSSVSAGTSHSCAVTVSGTVSCWGSNASGQLGDPTLTARSTAAPVSGQLSWSTVSAGGAHSCAITTAGVAHCWGSNIYGQVGDGTSGSTRTVPFPVYDTGTTKWAMVSSGGRHTCGVTQTGSGYCWGYNGSGQLGDGSSTSLPMPTLIAGFQWSSISAGDSHTCGITTAGIAYCWGANGMGQLGDGTTTPRTGPTAVGGNDRWRSISSGYQHTCGVNTLGQAFCWGAAVNGQVGDGSAAVALVPSTVDRSVPTASGSGQTFTAYVNLSGVTGNGTASATFTLGLTSSPGVVDTSGNALSAAIAGTRQSYILDNATGVAPSVTSISRVGTATRIDAQTVPSFKVVFSKPVVGVGVGSFYVARGPGIVGSPAVASVSPGVSVATTTFTVSLSTASVIGDGGAGSTVGLGVSPSSTIADLVGTALSSPDPSGVNQAFILDNVKPSLVSIVPKASAGFPAGVPVPTTGVPSPEFAVTYSEAVSGVATGSFVLEPGAGISGTPTLTATKVTFTSISSGADHSCAVTSVGTAYCWGANDRGQLGDGTPVSRNEPVPVTGELVWASLTAGSQFTCGVSTTGSAYCWGANDSGQLGDGTFTDRPSPVSVSTAATWTSVTAGSAHACAVTASSTFSAAGLAHCWGRNSSGQLGDGTTTVRTAPTAVSTTRHWAMVSAGGDHTCGLTATVSGTLEGTALCWGANTSGQLGDGTNSVRSLPTTVSTSLSFQGLSAGYRHTCAVTASSTFSVAGIATCWGLNANGQLGDGSTTNSPSPTTVAGSISWVTVVAGGSSTGSHTCGIVQSGDSYCWGANTAGQVGDTTTTSRTSPERVTGSLTWQAISVGASHTCAITTGLVPNCWGKNEVGQLGTGSSAVRALPADIGGRLSWTTLTVGDRHACGLVGSGIAYCWGDNASGQIGDASTTSRKLPTRVSGGLLWKSISAGYAHTCGITLSGIAYCWGANLEGQVGDGTLSSTRPSPTLVAGLLSWATISAGTSHTCGTTTANVAYCWGANGDGQLGDGTTISRTAPVAVSPMSGQASSSWASVRAGRSHTCGVTSGTVAACWGANGYGQLGDGSTVSRTSPAPVVVTGVVSQPFWTSVSAGGAYSCGLTTASTAYCWGENGLGQIGDGTSQSRVSPTVVRSSMSRVDAGLATTCGVDTSGNALCWGGNDSGQIGNGTRVSAKTPVTVSSGLGQSTTAVPGSSHTCAISINGFGSCWGLGSSGQLGDGVAPYLLEPNPVSGSMDRMWTLAVGMTGVRGDGGRDATATLKLKANPTRPLSDAAGNLATFAGTSTYTGFIVDTDTPTVTSITRTAPSAVTRGFTAPSYRVVFSEPVSGVGTSSFVVRLGSGVVGTPTVDAVIADASTTVSGLSSAYTVALGLTGVTGVGGEASSIDISVSGDALVNDAFGNSLTVTMPTGSVSGYILDTVAPRVTSITRAVGVPSLIGAQSTPTFMVTFSEAVTGVATSSFTVVTGPSVTGSPTVKSVMPASATTTFAVALDLTGTTASGQATSTIGLDIPLGAMIFDTAGNSIATGTTPAQLDVFTIDTVAPRLTTATPTDGLLADRINGTHPLTFQVVFTKSVTNVTAGAFTVERGSSVAGTPIIAVSGSGSIYDLSVGLSGLSAPGDGGSTLQIGLASPSPIADAAGNPVALEPSLFGAAKTLDTVRPEIASVRRPPLVPEVTAGALPVEFIVSMTEPVKDVSASTFAVKTGLGIIGAPIIRTFAPIPGSDTDFAIGVSLTGVIGAGDPTSTVGIVVASGAPGTDLAGNLVSPHTGNLPLASSNYVLSNLPPSSLGGGGSDPAPPRVIRVPTPVAPMPESPVPVVSTGSTTASPNQDQSPGGLPDAEPVAVSARQQIAFSDALKSAGSAATVTLLRLMDDLSPNQRSAVTAIVGSVDPAQSRALVSTLSTFSPGELATVSNVASTLTPSEIVKVFGALADLAQSGANVKVAVPDAMKLDVDGRETLTFSLDERDAASFFVDGAEVAGVYSSTIRRRSVVVLVRPGQQARIARPKSGNWPTVAVPLTYGDLAGVVPLVDPPEDASVLVFEPAPPGLNRVEQGSLGGGIVVPVAAPFRLTLKASAPDARAAVSMPSLVVPSGQTPAYLQSIRTPGGEFVGYLRSPAEFNPLTGRQDWSLTATELDRTLFLPVGLQTAFLINLSGSAHLYSGPDDNSTDFGLAAPANTIFPVIGPQVGLRIYVFNPVTKGYGWIDAQAVAPSGPPDIEDSNHSGDATPVPVTSQAVADAPPLPVTVRTRDPRTRVWSSAHPDATDFGPVGIAPVTYQVLKREGNRYYVVNPISGNYAWIDVDAVDEPGATPSSQTSGAPAQLAPAPKVATLPEFVRTRDAGTHVWSTPYPDATDFGPIGRAPVTYEVLQREATRYYVRNPITRNYAWIDIDAVEVSGPPIMTSPETQTSGDPPVPPASCTSTCADTPKHVRSDDPATHVWSTPYADATDFGSIGRAPVTYQVLDREADRYFVHNPETGNYSWIDIVSVTPMTEYAP